MKPECSSYLPLSHLSVLLKLERRHALISVASSFPPQSLYKLPIPKLGQPVHALVSAHSNQYAATSSPDGECPRPRVRLCSARHRSRVPRSVNGRGAVLWATSETAAASFILAALYLTPLSNADSDAQMKDSRPRRQTRRVVRVRSDVSVSRCLQSLPGLAIPYATTALSGRMSYPTAMKGSYASIVVLVCITKGIFLSVCDLELVFCCFPPPR